MSMNSSKTVEFYFDCGSPTAYLAFTQLPGIAARTGATIVYQPMLLGAVFKATGNNTPAAVPAKGAYMGRDIARCARRFGVPYASNPHFPVNTLNAMRGAVAAQHDGTLEPYLSAVFEALWVDGKDTSELETFCAVLRQARLEPERFGQRMQDQAIKDKLRADTEAAVARGVFGAPTFFVGDEMFFGQDRLDFVEAMLAAAPAIPEWADVSSVALDVT